MEILFVHVFVLYAEFLPRDATQSAVVPQLSVRPSVRL